MNRIAVLAAFAVSLLLASLLHAEPADTSSTQQNVTGQAATQPSAKKSPNDKKRTPEERARHTEERIKDLHQKLRITAEQETKWSAVAKTMRDNEAEISGLIDERHKNAATMDALEDLQSYEDITQAHADGIKRMIASFEPLYDDMSEDQKKNADQVFNSFQGNRVKSDKNRK